MSNEILLYVDANQEEIDNTKINVRSENTNILIQNPQTNSWISNNILWTKIPNTQKVYKLKLLSDFNTKNEIYIDILNTSSGEITKSKKFEIYNNIYYSQEYISKINTNIQKKTIQTPTIQYSSPTFNTNYVYSLLNTKFNIFLSISIFFLAIIIGIISKKYKMLELLSDKYIQKGNEFDTYIDNVLCNIWNVFFTRDYSE